MFCFNPLLMFDLLSGYLSCQSASVRFSGSGASRVVGVFFPLYGPDILLKSRIAVSGIYIFLFNALVYLVHVDAPTKFFSLLLSGSMYSHFN